jgi:protein arginine kinase activator
MLCQECQKRPATVHLAQIINHEQNVQHLCEQCAREKGEFNFDASPPFSIQNLLTGLMNMETSSAGQVVYQGKIQCENCGLTYAQFGQIGRFGCSRCYTTFGERLLPLMRRIHGSTQHVGKIPLRAGGAVKLRRSIDELRHQLQASIAREEFEEAARIRDQIRSLEEGGEKEHAE